MLLRWLVNPHFCRLIPAAGCTAPARWIGTAVTARKDDVSAADQAAMANVAG